MLLNEFRLWLLYKETVPHQRKGTVTSDSLALPLARCINLSCLGENSMTSAMTALACAPQPGFSGHALYGTYRLPVVRGAITNPQMY